jgi:prepilin-type processing-associated H-X9-DG protein
VRRINADLTLEADSRVLEHIRWEAGLTPHSRLMDEHIANLPPELRVIVYEEAEDLQDVSFVSAANRVESIKHDISSSLIEVTPQAVRETEATPHVSRDRAETSVVHDGPVQEDFQLVSVQDPHSFGTHQTTQGGAKLIEYMVIIAMIGVMCALLTPAIAAAREAQRRAQCVNNLKQLGLAALNYESANGCYPSGSYTNTTVGRPIENFSCFVRLLPFFEQQQTYHATNFALTYECVQNITLTNLGLNVLMCPSDPWVPVSITPAAPGFMRAVPATGTWNEYFTSYAGVEGTFVQRYLSTYPVAEQSACNGMIYGEGTVTIASVTDGTGNTFLFGEKAHTSLALYQATAAQPSTRFHMWTSGFYTDTTLCTYFPPNPESTRQDIGAMGIYYANQATSRHAGGVNFAFCDGSVRFIKNTINSWSMVRGSSGASGMRLPAGVTYSNFVYTINAGAQPGVYQQLTTRSGGEVVSESQF